MERLRDRVVLVSGGGGGIGGAQARLFAGAGAKVVVGDVDAAGAERVAGELGAAAIHVHLDVTDESSWSSAIEAATSAFGKLDGFVNNAGIYDPAPMGETTVELFDQIMSVNARGTFLGLRAVAPAIAAAGGGSIVLISSGAAMGGYDFMFAYGISKWAVRGTAHYAANALIAKGIRVNAIMPGAIDTTMMAKNSPEMLEMVPAMIPAGRMGEPEEIAEGALFLLSDEASYINGSELIIDGGTLG